MNINVKIKTNTKIYKVQRRYTKTQQLVKIILLINVFLCNSDGGSVMIAQFMRCLVYHIDQMRMRVRSCITYTHTTMCSTHTIELTQLL